MRLLKCLVPLLSLTFACEQAPAQRLANPAPPVLSAQELFKKVSPSVFVILSLDSSNRPVEQGSAVVIGNGLLETNYHVVKDGVSFKVQQGSKKWPATLVATNPEHDIAELSVQNLPAAAVLIRPFSSLAVGERVYAIGAPEGLELTFSEGLISSLRQSAREHIIQTTAAISPGSSGGGLFDVSGRLVGITVAYLKEGENLNFALPADSILSLSIRSAAEWAELGSAAYEAGQKYDGSIEYDLAAPSSYGGWAIASVSPPGKASLALQSYKDATADYQQSLRLDPQNQEVWRHLGSAWEALAADSISARFSKAFKQAINAYQQALRLKPDDEKAWLGLGLAYHLQSGHAQETINAFKSALRLNAKDLEAWESLGNAYTELGKEENALAAFDTAQSFIEPNDEEAWKLLGVHYLSINLDHPSQKFLEQASACELRALNLRPADPEAWFDLGVVYADKKDRVGVMKVYGRLKTLDSQIANYFFQEAVLPNQQ